MLTFFVLANLIIVLAYMSVGFYVVPRFSVGGRNITIIKYAMLTFFIFCAGTHLELALHAMGESKDIRDWLLSWHMVITHGLQAIASPITVFYAYKYLKVPLYEQP